MDLKKKQILLGFLIIASISFPFFSVNNLKIDDVDKIYYTDFYDLRTSQWVVSSPIVVNESDPTQNWASTAASEPWCSGSGIWSDPYIIQDVILDQQGADDSCITIIDSTIYFQIIDCTLINSGWGSYGGGIYLENTNNGRIQTNNCSNHKYNGIYLHESDNNTIVGNIALNNQIGIELTYSDYNTITGNAPNFNSVFGITISRSDNNTIIGNVLSNNRLGLSLYDTENCTVTANSMSSCGITVSFMEYNLAEFLTNEIDISNTVNGKPVYYYSSINNLRNSDFINPGQIILVNCSDSVLSDFAISYGTHGMQVIFCDNITLYNNDITQCVTGITIGYSTFINVSDNTASNNEAGLSLGSSKNCTISGNTLNDNADLINMWGSGINIGSCENCTISDNTANNNYESGLEVWHSEDIEIEENTFNYNRIGIRMGEIVDCEFEGNIIDGAASSFDNWDIGIHLLAQHGGGTFNNTFKNNIMTNCGFYIGDYEDLEGMVSQNIDVSNLVNGKPVYYYTNQIGLSPTNFTNAGQVFLINTNSSDVDGLLFTNTSIGMQLFYSHGNTISNCEFQYIKLDSFELWYCEDNVIDGNTFRDTNGNHLGLYYGNGNHITGNSITDDPMRNPNFGIILADCNNTVVLRNHISNCVEGIMANGEYNSFSGNNLSNNVFNGIYLSSSTYNTVINNTLNNNEDGLILENTHNTNILNNTMNYNRGYGIKLYDSNSNTVTDNIFRCNRDGCWLDEGGTGNTILNNVCEDCPDDGNGNGDPGFVPGYNLIIIIGILGIISAILLRKRYKH